jgi:hypothetical protein
MRQTRYGRYLEQSRYTSNQRLEAADTRKQEQLVMSFDNAARHALMVERAAQRMLTQKGLDDAKKATLGAAESKARAANLEASRLARSAESAYGANPRNHYSLDRDLNRINADIRQAERAYNSAL